MEIAVAVAVALALALALENMQIIFNSDDLIENDNANNKKKHLSFLFSFLSSPSLLQVTTLHAPLPYLTLPYSRLKSFSSFWSPGLLSKRLEKCLAKVLIKSTANALYGCPHDHRSRKHPSKVA